MAASRLLIVNSSPAISRELAAHLPAASWGYEHLEATCRETLFNFLQYLPPDLIVVSQVGVPDLSLREVLEAAARSEIPIPVIILEERRNGRPSLPAQQDSNSVYLRWDEIDRLPSLIERTLCDVQVKKTQFRLQKGAKDSAGLMQESQKLVTMGRLASSIAHEINNPLEAVTNLLFLVSQEEDLSPATRRYLAQAHKELGRAVEISKQTLNFCREAPAPVQVKLSSLLEEVLILYRRKISEKHLELHCAFRDGEPLLVFPGEIRQVLSNLVNNAIDASRDGGSLYLRSRKSRFWRDPAVAGVRVTIADTGSGMPPEIRRRIGSPFFTTKGQAGTGLGLWVSRSIIQRYAGHLCLRSSTGNRHGSVFTVFLPAKQPPHAGSELPPLSRASAPRA